MHTTPTENISEAMNYGEGKMFSNKKYKPRSAKTVRYSRDKWGEPERAPH